MMAWMSDAGLVGAGGWERDGMDGAGSGTGDGLGAGLGGGLGDGLGDGAGAHMSADAFRRHGHAMVDWIASYHERLRGDSAPPVLSGVRAGDVAGAMARSAPEHGVEMEHAIATLQALVEPGLTHWQHPSFFGYFPCNASFPAMLGELMSAGVNVQGMLWQTSPAATEVETRVLDWMCDAIGLPGCFRSDAEHAERGGGVIQGTASEAVVVALVAARDRARRAVVAGGAEACPIERLRAYASAQAHSSIVKGAMVAGLGREGVRLIETDDRWRMDAGALERAMREDAARGLVPCFVGATLGTTSTGAVDPLGAIGEAIGRFGSDAAGEMGGAPWLHVDAAYAGSALVCAEHRWMIEGVERADSFNFNPHKWLLTNFDCSLLWTRRRSDVLESLSILPEYLRNAATDEGAVIDYRDWQIPLGRRFRALKLWLVLHQYGLEGLREIVRSHCAWGERFAAAIAGDGAGRFELVDRAFSLVTLRVRARCEDDGDGRGDAAACADAGDALTKRVLDAVNASGLAYLTHTRVPVRGRDRTLIRVAIGGTHTREKHVEALLGLLRRTVDELRE
ncbi:MAG: pyridoxal-dependent decarboxylase [Phycisphaerales bacterium]